MIDLYFGVTWYIWRWGKWIWRWEGTSLPVCFLL